VISPGAEVRHKAATIRTGEGIRLAGKVAEERIHQSTHECIQREEFLTSTQTHRPYLGDTKGDSSIWGQKLLLGNFLIWGWSVHGIFTYKIRAQLGKKSDNFGLSRLKSCKVT
jgi:hypothetical protein